MPLVNVMQAAQELACSESFLRKQMGRRDFPQYRLGSDVRLDLTELRAWFRRNSRGPSDHADSLNGSRTNDQGAA